MQNWKKIGRRVDRTSGDEVFDTSRVSWGNFSVAFFFILDELKKNRFIVLTFAEQKKKKKFRLHIFISWLWLVNVN